MREDAGGRLVALLRSELFCADPLELNGQKLKQVVVEGSAVVAGGASDSCEIVSVHVNFPLSHPVAVVDLRSNDVC